MAEAPTVLLAVPPPHAPQPHSQRQNQGALTRSPARCAGRRRRAGSGGAQRSCACARARRACILRRYRQGDAHGAAQPWHGGEQRVRVRPVGAELRGGAADEPGAEEPEQSGALLQRARVCVEGLFSARFRERRGGEGTRHGGARPTLQQHAPRFLCLAARDARSRAAAAPPARRRAADAPLPCRSWRWSRERSCRGCSFPFGPAHTSCYAP